jgi:hypothetical protein
VPNLVVACMSTALESIEMQLKCSIAQVRFVVFVLLLQQYINVFYVQSCCVVMQRLPSCQTIATKTVASLSLCQTKYSIKFFVLFLLSIDDIDLLQ